MCDDIPNSLLNRRDREWLKGELEYDGKNAKQTRYERRRGIGERLEAGIGDLALLAEHFDKLHGHGDDIDVEKWDTALKALLDLHPSAPTDIDTQELRSIGNDLTEKADRIDGVLNCSQNGGDDE